MTSIYDPFKANAPLLTTNLPGSHTHHIGKPAGNQAIWQAQQQVLLHETARATKKIPALEAKLAKIENQKGRDLPAAVKRYYKSLPQEDIIACLGHQSPMWGGRPNRLALALLMAAPSPVNTSKAGHFYNAGLMFYLPYHGLKRRSRLTAQGLGLLDFWADKFPRFVPFRDAYVPDQAREDIISMCVDFDIGILPAGIAKMEEDYGRRMKERQEEKERQKQQYLAVLQQAQADFQLRNAQMKAQYQSMTNRTLTGTRPNIMIIDEGLPAAKVPDTNPGIPDVDAKELNKEALSLLDKLKQFFGIT